MQKSETYDIPSTHSTQYSQFALHIYNVDQTLLLFEFLQTRTYDIKAVKTVWIRTAHTSLTACANGIMQCPPLGNGYIYKNRGV